MPDEPSIRSEAVQAYRETARCPYCYEDLVATGTVLACHPPLYGHECPDENAYEHQIEGNTRFFNLDHAYPRITYRNL